MLAALKEENLISSPVIQSPNPFERNHQSTERLSKGSTCQKVNNIFIKQTERNQIRSHLQSPVVLTDKQSSSKSINQSWKFDPQLYQQQEQIEQIEYFLKRQGLLDVFNCFETFRNLLVESMSQPYASKTTRTKVNLFQAVANLKAGLLKLATTSPSKTFQEREDDSPSIKNQLKIVLLQISKLRTQNDHLRVKIEALKSRLRSFESGHVSFDNSLLNNSISYISSSFCSSQQIDDVQVPNEMNYLCSSIKASTLKETSKSTTLSLGNSIKDSSKNNNILEEEYYQTYSIECSRISMKKDSDQAEFMVRVAGDILNQYCIRDEQYALIIRFIKGLKEMFKRYFQACNLALLRSPSLKKVEQILISYKTFRPNSTSKASKSFLNQTSNFLSFIQDHCTKLSTIIEEEMSIQLKRKPHD